MNIMCMHLPSLLIDHDITQRLLLSSMQNYILVSLDNSKGVLLILLDLRVAFDTIDHSILITCLESRIGVTGTALERCRSYLSDQSQVIYLDGVSSKGCLVLYIILHLTMVSVYTCMLMTLKFILSLILPPFLPHLPNQD